MPLDTIDQPVNPGDLILAYTCKPWVLVSLRPRADEQSSDEASDDDDWTEEEGDARNSEVKPLRAFLDELAGSLDIIVVVNPHGREVLEHCFSGTCPRKEGLEWLEREEHWIRDYRRQAKESELSKSDKKRLREIKHEILKFLEEKYEAINERKKEMGLPLDDVDEQVKDYTDCMFSF
ncbi:hypothetical protein ATEIFO6365_0001096700 [Aspergillus terreus]|uniref:Uncharacterized protein n=1 Tax=Aspergillus terreus TaxID=33178 RepID=A0A5M3YNW0_ASPTE|nr:hypothetical protein ATETN484_0001088800 [Aspergillus terreus]GFF12743.1 hypothetical protein ATEIFO6365_0001096700 [Aspergillus terreus]